MDSPYAHLAWSRQLGIPFPMVSDFNRQILPALDALGPGSPYMAKTARRTAFLIDPSRTIRYAWYPPPEGGFPPIPQLIAEAKRLSERRQD